MGKLRAFVFITLNGFYKGIKEDISWNTHDDEENQYSNEMLKSGDTLLFGRITYELMASYWPTQFALENNPVLANGMNAAEKIVFSRTLKNVAWNNTRLVTGNIIEEVKKLKLLPGKDMTILGSGSILTQFADHGLIDEFQILLDPIVLGEGTSLFHGLGHPLPLKLIDTKTFKNGNILLNYGKKEI